MRGTYFKMICLALLCYGMSLQAMAQGIVVNKKDGTKVYYKASEVQSVGVYGYDEGEGEGETVTVNGVSFRMISVEGGSFLMGSAIGDEDEMPVHEVKLNSFTIGQTEVTQELWKAVMGTNPSNFMGDKRPVEKVSWNDCQAFVVKLNELTGKKFRLPTEAEWEFAARGGNKSNGFLYSGSNNLDDVAWYNTNSGSMTHDVGMKAPNELGLYDMSGNVWEWCQDWYGEEYYAESVVNNPQGTAISNSRVLRGGGWTDKATDCRTTYRYDYAPTYNFFFIGLRLVQ